MSNAMSLFNDNEETAMMNSLELRDLVNEARVANGERNVRNTSFLMRVEDELSDQLPVAHYMQPPMGGTPQRYYDLTHDQCMLVGMRESKAVRRSVLEMLKAMEKQIQKPQLPQTYAGALRELADQTELNEELKQEVSKAAPKVQFYDTVTQSTEAHSMQAVAKMINFQKMGRNNLMKFLREEGIFMKGETVPYQRFVTSDHFKICEDVDGNPFTVAYQKGIDLIVQRLLAKGHKRK